MLVTKYVSGGSGLALKPKRNITKSPKTGVSVAQQKDKETYVLQNFSERKCLGLYLQNTGKTLNTEN